MSNSIDKQINCYLKNVECSAPDKETAEYWANYWDGRYREVVLEGEKSHGYGSTLNAYIKREAFRKYLEEKQWKTKATNTRA